MCFRGTVQYTRKPDTEKKCMNVIDLDDISKQVAIILNAAHLSNKNMLGFKYIAIHLSTLLKA